MYSENPTAWGYKPISNPSAAYGMDPMTEYSPFILHPEPILVICDGSKSGVRALYGQGPDWQSRHPAGFLSKKFSSAQQNYHTHEHDTIAILEALIKWEDKLLG